MCPRLGGGGEVINFFYVNWIKTQAIKASSGKLSILGDALPFYWHLNLCGYLGSGTFEVARP